MEEIEERIRKIEEEIRKTPYHKGTEHHIGRLKARIAKLKDDLQTKKGGGKASLPAGRQGFAIKKTGDATVVLVGPPSVGKSTLINQLSAASSKVGSYDFTTTQVIPGMMEYKRAKIQILDLPGLISGAASGKGRGREIISVARSADLLLLMVDINTLPFISNLKTELYQTGIRLEEEEPNVLINPKTSGGIKIIATVRLTQVNLETITGVADEFRLKNAEIIIREDISLERLLDSFSPNRVYLPYLSLVNKVDQLPLKDLRVEPKQTLYISAEKKIGLEELKEKIWQKLKLLRVYLKSDEGVDFKDPVILREGERLRSILNKVTFANAEAIKAAKIYGTGAKFPGQKVSLNFIPQDEEIVSFV
jgi:ribosome-interacting GTPase 1